MNADHPKHSPPNAKAFTLIELLVVVAIIAVLVSILLPALASVRKRTKDLMCETNLRSLWQATLLYAQDNHDRLPPVPWTSAAWSEPQHNQSFWVDQLVPYIAKSLQIELVPGKVDHIFRCPYDGTWDGWGRRSSYMVYPELAQNGWMLTAFSQPSRTTYMKDVIYLWHLDPISMRGCNISFLDGHVEYAPGSRADYWYWE
ncbi:MAG: prepilin-type N-terminal cleavage/methylation domain-containing protein [Phycisphaerae bacterium]|nr:prepilin-type N-terminal cleavage/methylation domain-containing protein [Phycisphaerae bacterium]